MKKQFLILLAGVAFLTACKKDAQNGMLTLNLSGLEDLGSTAQYEGWMIVDGEAITTGRFTVNANGELSKTTFEVDESDLKDASRFVLTIEPEPDNDPGASSIHILAGDFSGNSAAVSVDHSSAIGTNFSTSTGTYILATPTTADTTDESSGVWFLDNSSGAPATGLSLPNLPNGWVYEGWAVVNGIPVSTGTFTVVDAVDQDASFSGSGSGPNYPGEDFVQNAPAGLSFPTDLAGAAIVISVEPFPDNSSAPFTIKPLMSTVSDPSVVHTAQSMSNIAANNIPTGSVSR